MKWNLLDEHLTPEQALKEATFWQRFIPFFAIIWCGTLFLRIVFRSSLIQSSPLGNLLGMLLLEVTLTFGALLFYNVILFQIRHTREVIKRVSAGTGMITVLLLMVKAFQVAATAVIVNAKFGDTSNKNKKVIQFFYDAYWLDITWISIDFVFIFLLLNMMNILKPKSA